MMESVSTWLWTKLKNHPSGWIVLLFIVGLVILELVGLFSDIGFGDEVKKYRWILLASNLLISSVIVLVWFLVVTILENVILQEKISDLNYKETLLPLSQQVISSLLEEVTKERRLGITKVQLYNDSIYIVLSKKRTQNLSIGDEVKVFDDTDGSVIGIFEVSENNQAQFRAKVNNYISPVWEGYIRQNGNTESLAPPNTLAILFPKEVIKDEQ